jgi:antitoxin (DNA-binding transcriptional repressor) of toxin-antitoxin stability system
MVRIDLDDLPPRIAQLLTSAAQGEEVLLVQGGAVAGRLTGGAPQAPASQAPEPLTDQERAAELFEQFRSQMEDEF